MNRIMAIEIELEEARARLMELLRGVQLGKRYTITLHGEAVASLVPADRSARADAAAAAGQMLAFMRSRDQGCSVDLRALVDEGRA